MATGSETERLNFSLIVFFSLSRTVNITIYSPCHGSGILIYPGFPSPSLDHLNPSLDVISRLYAKISLPPIGDVALPSINTPLFASWIQILEGLLFCIFFPLA